MKILLAGAMLLARNLAAVAEPLPTDTCVHFPATTIVRVNVNPAML